MDILLEIAMEWANIRCSDDKTYKEFNIRIGDNVNMEGVIWRTGKEF